MTQETQFRKSLEKAVSIIRNGSKKGLDNIELFLPEEDRKNLSPLLHIINNAEIEYKQGNAAKIESMESMILDSYIGDNYGIEMLMIKADEISEVLGYYRDACSLIEEKLYGKSVTPRNSLVPPSFTEPVSPEDYRTFEQLKGTRDNILKNRNNVNVKVIEESKKRCEQKYAQTSGECSWVIGAYAMQ